MRLSFRRLLVTDRLLGHFGRRCGYGTAEKTQAHNGTTASSCPNPQKAPTGEWILGIGMHIRHGRPRFPTLGFKCAGLGV